MSPSARPSRGAAEPAVERALPRSPIDFLGRAEALRGLSLRAAAGTLPPAVLLFGPEGSGKEAAAIELACLLLCVPTPERDPNTRRLVRALQHPDLRFAFAAEAGLTDGGLRPLLDAKAREPLARIRQPSSAVIPIGDADDPLPGSVREIRRFVAMTPFQAPRRVVIVADAHRMNRQAANALLKTLEEPPSSAHLILCTHQPAALPSTIRSRCTQVRVPALALHALAAHLEQVHDLPAAEAERLAAVSGGNARQALDLIDPQARRIGQWAAALLAMLAERRAPALLRGAELLAKGQDPSGAPGGGRLSDASLTASRDLGMRALDFMIADLLALARLRAHARTPEALGVRLAPMAVAFADRDPSALAAVLVRAREDLARNVNVSLVLTHAFCEALRPAGRSQAAGAGGDAELSGEGAPLSPETIAAQDDGGAVSGAAGGAAEL